MIDSKDELLIHAVFNYAGRLQDLDDANPDVGMGYPWTYFVECAVKQLNITDSQVLEEIERRKIL